MENISDNPSVCELGSARYARNPSTDRTSSASEACARLPAECSASSNFNSNKRSRMSVPEYHRPCSQNVAPSAFETSVAQALTWPKARDLPDILGNIQTLQLPPEGQAVPNKLTAQQKRQRSCFYAIQKIQTEYHSDIEFLKLFESEQRQKLSEHCSQDLASLKYAAADLNLRITRLISNLRIGHFSTVDQMLSDIQPTKYRTKKSCRSKAKQAANYEGEGTEEHLEKGENEASIRCPDIQQTQSAPCDLKGLASDRQSADSTEFVTSQFEDFVATPELPQNPLHIKEPRLCQPQWPVFSEAAIIGIGQPLSAPPVSHQFPAVLSAHAWQDVAMHRRMSEPARAPYSRESSCSVGQYGWHSPPCRPSQRFGTPSAPLQEARCAHFVDHVPICDMATLDAFLPFLLEEEEGDEENWTEILRQIPSIK